MANRTLTTVCCCGTRSAIATANNLGFILLVQLSLTGSDIGDAGAATLAMTLAASRKLTTVCWLDLLGAAMECERLAKQLLLSLLSSRDAARSQRHKYRRCGRRGACEGTCR